eukprot:TRINITY_DN27352_c0_g1_i1.p1 TRINITY_DN27352_c0_g1~~TRINITY_DN27352_c0_g1_i1.p1  ORF type:complete len:259 (+),score=59.57 TRINITY_DN27352_c0_g1_i1:65-841(+)
MAGNCLRTANDEIVTTEWEDIQYKFGNKVGKYATREEEIRQQKEMKDIIENVIDNYDPLENRTVEQLDEMLQEDGRGDDDEDALVAYRRARRMEELERQRGTKFGSIRHITKSEYVSEVSKAGEDIWVLCLLIEEGNAHCEYLLRIMSDIAERNSALKIVSIKSTDAIDKFPASHLPTVLVYHSGEMKKQITTLKPWCKTEARPTLEEVEDYLRTIGPLRNARRVVESDSEEEEEEDRRAPAAGRIGRATGKSKFSLV